MATKSIPAVDRQKAYVAALEMENFKFGLTVGTAFVRGIRDIGYKRAEEQLHPNRRHR